MSFAQYWDILIKQWKLIIITTLFLGLGTFVVSRLMTPVYQSAAIVEVSIRSANNQPDINALLASDQLVQTEAQLSVSNPVLREVASHYPGMSVEQLQQNASATAKANTQLFEIDVQDLSATRAARLANDIANTLIKQEANTAQQYNLQSQQQLQQNVDGTRKLIDADTANLAQLQAQQSALMDQQKQAELQAQRTNTVYQPNPQLLKQLSDLQSKIAVLQNQLNQLQQQYSQWQTALAQLESTEAQSSGFLRIAQPAQPNTIPIRPKVPLYTAVGLLVGCLTGIVLAILLESLDTRVRSEEALTRLIDISVLSTVWKADDSKNNKEGIVNPPQHSLNVESFRILRTNIGFSAVGEPLRSIMVTSAVPHEGKSTIAANLAIYMAKSGKSTLLVDTDLRRPTLGKLFNLAPDRMGLSNAVVACSGFQVGPRQWQSIGQAPNGHLLQPYLHPVDIPNLLVMPSGPLPPNPPELFDSKAMKVFFDLIANCGAEIVIFDTPPMLGLSDTRILVPKIDGVLLVVDISSANRKNLRRVDGMLKQAGGRVLGCVLNKQARKRKDKLPSYYYYYSPEESQNSQNGHVPAAPAGPAISRPPEPR